MNILLDLSTLSRDGQSLISDFSQPLISLILVLTRDELHRWPYRVPKAVF